MTFIEQTRVPTYTLDTVCKYVISSTPQGGMTKYFSDKVKHHCAEYACTYLSYTMTKKKSRYLSHNAKIKVCVDRINIRFTLLFFFFSFSLLRAILESGWYYTFYNYRRDIDNGDRGGESLYYTVRVWRQDAEKKKKKNYRNRINHKAAYRY